MFLHAPSKSAGSRCRGRSGGDEPLLGVPEVVGHREPRVEGEHEPNFGGELQVDEFSMQAPGSILTLFS